MSDALDALNVDIDTRLTELWLVLTKPGTVFTELVQRDELIRDVLGEAVRYAYARGYLDALDEDRDGRRAELHRTHGYRPE